MKINKNCSTLHKLQITILVFIIHIEAHPQMCETFTDTVLGWNNAIFMLFRNLLFKILSSDDIYTLTYLGTQIDATSQPFASRGCDVKV